MVESPRNRLKSGVFARTVEFPLARPPFTGATIVRFHRPFLMRPITQRLTLALIPLHGVPSLSFLISSLPHVARPLASAPGATLYDVIKFFLHRTFAKSATRRDRSFRASASSARETPGTSHREEKGTGNCCAGRPIVWPPCDHPCISPILHRYYCKLQLHRSLFEKRPSRILVSQRNVRSIFVETLISVTRLDQSPIWLDLLGTFKRGRNLRNNGVLYSEIFTKFKIEDFNWTEILI